MAGFEMPLALRPANCPKMPCGSCEMQPKCLAKLRSIKNDPVPEHQTVEEYLGLDTKVDTPPVIEVPQTDEKPSGTGTLETQDLDTGAGANTGNGGDGSGSDAGVGSGDATGSDANDANQGSNDANDAN